MSPNARDADRPWFRLSLLAAVAALVLSSCFGGGSSPPDSYEEAEEDYFVGCLEPDDGGQLARYEDGELVDPEGHANLDTCNEMWEDVMAKIDFDDFVLAAGALRDEPALLELDEIPDGLVADDDVDRLETTVAKLRDIAESAGTLA